jgi:hypothetical protein
MIRPDVFVSSIPRRIRFLPAAGRVRLRCAAASFAAGIANDRQ